MKRTNVKKYRASKLVTAKKAAKKVKPYVAVLLHDGDLRGTFVSDDYFEVLKFAGDFWQTADYGFDIAKAQPFFIPADYSNDDFSVQTKNGRVTYVHSYDETIYIGKMGKIGW